jgi:hypothetical protein
MKIKISLSDYYSNQRKSTKVTIKGACADRFLDFLTMLERESHSRKSISIDATVGGGPTFKLYIDGGGVDRVILGDT